MALCLTGLIAFGRKIEHESTAYFQISVTDKYIITEDYSFQPEIYLQVILPYTL